MFTKRFNTGRHRGVPALRFLSLTTVIVAVLDRRPGRPGQRRQQRPSKSVTIGSKDFTEHSSSPNSTASLEASGYDVDVKRNLGSTTITDAAVRKGDIDVYAEYTGTIFLYVCKLKYTAGITFARLYAGDQRCYSKRGLQLLQPARFNNGNAIACRRSFTRPTGSARSPTCGA